MVKEGLSAPAPAPAAFVPVMAGAAAVGYQPPPAPSLVGSVVGPRPPSRSFVNARRSSKTFVNARRPPKTFVTARRLGGRLVVVRPQSCRLVVARQPRTGFVKVRLPFNAAAAPYSPAGGDPTQLLLQQPKDVKFEPPAPALSAVHFAPAPEPLVEDSRSCNCSRWSLIPSYRLPSPASRLRYPWQPGKGVIGRRCIVKANHFFANLPGKDLHQCDVAIVPEVA